MLFSINASKMLLGLEDTFRLKKDGTWKKQKDFKLFDESDFLFDSYSSAQYWLQQQSTVTIEGESVPTIDDPKEGFDLLDFSKINFEIILHRTSEPNNSIFTKEQVMTTLLKGDDNHHNSLIIDFDGYPRLVPLHNRTALTLSEYAVRFGTFDAGGGYVGPDNLLHLDNTYTILLEYWLLHLISGRELYTDGRISDKTEEQIMSEIKDELAKLRERKQSIKQ